MKKLAVGIIMIAITLFSIPAMAADSEVQPFFLDATYALSATGSCLHATGGFSGVVPSGNTWGASTMTEGTWLFRPDGTGYASLTNHIVTPPPGAPAGLPMPIPPIDTKIVGFPFTYAANTQGVIVVWMSVLASPPSTPPSPSDFKTLELVGRISIDKKTLVLNSSNQCQYVPDASSYAICNVTRVLTRVADD